MEKYFCALELYCNLTAAELICHLRCCSIPGRAYLRKDNSRKNGSKGISFTVFKRRQKAYCDKHRDLGKVMNTWDTPFKVKWPKDFVFALGIHFSNSEKVSGNLNFCEKLDVLEKTLNNWKRRKLTLLGKIDILLNQWASQSSFTMHPYCQSLKTSVIR